MIKINENEFKELPHDDEVESRARTLFRSACENADSYHTLRLGLARRKALTAGAARFFAPWVWGPLAGSAAACAIVVGLLWLRPFAQPQVVQATPPQPVLATPRGDIDDTLAIGSNQMEMVQDLDFYRWLATQQDAPTTSGRSTR